MKKKWLFSDVIIYGIVFLISILCLLPILNTLAISLSSSAQAMAGKVSLWPKNFTVAAYEYVMNDRMFYSSFFTSIKRVILGTALNFIMMVLAAFPLSHSEKSFCGRNMYMYVLIFTMLFNGGLIPLYIVVTKLNLLDSIWALILPGAVPIWNAILLMNFFRSLPSEIEEACFIDGAQPYQVLIKVFLPISLPSLATVTLFSLVGHWNEFFSAMIYMNSSSNYPLATYIYTMVDTAKDLSVVTDPEELEALMKTSDTTVNSAKIFISMIPILAIYPFMQKYFVTGLVMGAVKG